MTAQETPPVSVRLQPRAALRAAGSLLLIVTVAGAFLAAFEGFLRLTGYGETTRPFLTHTFDGKTYWRINPSFYRQFFSVPPYMMVDWDEFEFVLPADKAPNAVRIFVLGGSAAHGDPDPKRGFPRQLEYMLRATLPGIEPEVYTVAFPAANSHLMRALAAACARLQPDFIIVYMGNNEFAGPFNDPHTGASGIVTPPTLVRMRIALSDSRIVQWLNNMLTTRLNVAGLLQTRCHPFAPETPPVEGDAGNYFYDNFAENLESICHLSEEAGARVVLCTVASNVRHWKPMGSGNSPALAESELAPWRELMDEGRAAEARGDWATAARVYGNALTIDGGHAELHYRYATCLWRLGNFDAAREHFYRARDLDVFHWRADARLNAIVVEVAARHANHAALADAEGALARASDHGAPGGEFFHDYVHLNFEGCHEIARCIAETMIPLWRRARADASKAHPSPPALEACRRAFAVNAAEDQATLLEEDLYNYVEEGSCYGFDDCPSPRAMLGPLRERMRSEPHLAVCYRAGLAEFPQDRRLRQAFTRLLLDAGYARDALEQARILQEYFPHYRTTLSLLAEALLDSDEGDKANATMEAAERLYPGDALTAYGASTVYAHTGQSGAALRCYETAARKEPYFPGPAHSLVLQMFDASNDWERARDQFSALLHGFPLLEALNHRMAPELEEFDSLLQKYATPSERRAFWQELAAARPGVLLFALYAIRAREDREASPSARQVYGNAFVEGGDVLEDVCAMKRRAVHYLERIQDAQAKGDLAAAAFFAWRQTLQPAPALRSKSDAATAVAGFRRTLSLPPFDDVTLLRFAEALSAAQDRDGTLRLCRCMVDTGSTSVPAHDLLIRTLAETGRTKEAAEQHAQSAAAGVAVSPVPQVPATTAQAP
ncbi:MAG: tetratricopeptide repeat protein [Candidatus Hydrogenedentes bacterium]|nr:tetratricopeptide repeat protein [Candidatus Hydrogenedentota bacterium]